MFFMSTAKAREALAAAVAADAKAVAAQADATIAIADAAAAAALAATKHRFIDRGNVANPDFVKPDFTEDSSWNELSLAAIIPEGSVAVLVTLRLKNGLSEPFIRFRKSGLTNELTTIFASTPVANKEYYYTLVIPVNDVRKIDYYLFFCTQWIHIDMTVLGWFVP